MNYSIDIFNFNNVADYNSDETSVDLLDTSGKILAIFSYPMFTRADFVIFKQKSLKRLTLNPAI